MTSHRDDVRFSDVTAIIMPKLRNPHPVRTPLAKAIEQRIDRNFAFTIVMIAH